MEEAKWYVLHTFSGYENVAKENLETVRDKFNLENRIFDIIIPMEEVMEEKNGKKKLVRRKVMPCYLIVKMIYGDDIWHNITRTRGITGFVGHKGRPLALTEDEVRKLHLENVKVELDLKEGDKVQMMGFGTFEIKERAARTGRKPSTGETIEIPAKKSPVFKAGKGLKDQF